MLPPQAMGGIVRDGGYPAPKTGTALLLCFRFEACFACDISNEILRCV